MSLFDNLVDPVDKSCLQRQGDTLVSSGGRRYPIVEGIPILLVPDVEQTTMTGRLTLDAVAAEHVRDRLYLQTTGIGRNYIDECRNLFAGGSGTQPIDPVIAFLVMRGGHMYHHLIGNLRDYPIPEIRLPDMRKALTPPRLLDIGSNWGRWSLSAARKGYDVVALDPSLGALLAGRRAAEQLSLSIGWVAGDARFLPFRDNVFDQVFSYSVLQHFNVGDFMRTLNEVRRVMSEDGKSLIQMAHIFGIRSGYHLMRRGFHRTTGMDVRYYTIPHLMTLFTDAIGPSTISVDGYFGLGIQEADLRFMTSPKRAIVRTSTALRRLSNYFAVLKWVADSLYVSSSRNVRSSFNNGNTRS